MSEWNVIHENLHTKYGVFTAPDAHVHESLSYTLWAYNQRERKKRVGRETKDGKGKEKDREDREEAYLLLVADRENYLSVVFHPPHYDAVSL